MNLLLRQVYKLTMLITFFITVSNSAKAQTETLSTGSFIINMGATNPNTVGNGLKPYGLIYDLMRTHNVPIKWVISQTKAKDGVDFTYNGVQYKGGTFIIPAEFRSAAVNARITFWTGAGVGVVGTTTTSPLTVSVTQTLTAIPKWTLDSQNGDKAEAYLIAAGITNAAFPGAYNWKAPASLDCCDDFFVMPHADPVWATHSRLLSWNLDCKGSIWAACHATSALENMVNPANRAIQTNFLTQKVAGLAGTSGNYALSNSLILWGSHGGGSVPYIHQYPNDIVAQYLGPTDAAHQNGSEQIDVPNQSATGGWNPGAKIIAYDPTQADVTNPIRPDKTNAAAVIVFGRGFDDPNRGFVMYEPAHSHAGTAGPNVAAQRVFLNFSFFQVQPKAPQLTVTGVISGQQVTGGTSINGLNVVATSPLAGITFTYLWSSTCGGTFSSATAATTNFTAPVVGAITNCIITCKVTDNCGRVSFQSIPVVILPPPAAPIVVNDVANLAGSCSPGTSVTLNVLTNDVPNPSTITFTSLNQGAASPANAGTWTSDGLGNVTFTPNANFNGAATITYTVTNTQGQTNTATITVNVGSTDVNGCTSNQVYSPTDVDLITLATGSFISQSGTTATVDELSLDDAENIYSDKDADFVDFAKAVANNLILSIGSTLPLRAKDTINLTWAKKNGSNTGTISIQIGVSAAGPWTNAQTFTNSTSGTPSAVAITSSYILPAGASGITHIRINAGTFSPSTVSAEDVYVDAVEYLYMSCVNRAPQLSYDAVTVLEDAVFNVNVLANDIDPQGLALTVGRIVTQPANGKVSINLDGTITFVSNVDNATATSFVYEACNTQGYCSTATVNLTIVADGCPGSGNFRATPPAGNVTKFFQSGFAGTNAATANPTSTNFLDSKLNQASGGNDNYGGDNKYDVGKVFASTQALRNIFQFNISEIPTNAVVQSATFSAYRAGGNSDLQNVKLHGLTQSFVENQVTWTNRITATPWTTAGGSIGAVVDSANLNGTKTRYSWNVKSLVDGWVATPANNFGVLLKTGETLGKTHQLNSKEIGTVGFRPGLSVTYVVPEPCAAITNRAPMANPDFATTVNGQSVIISPLPNDGDIDAGNTFTITAISGITAGSATFTGTTITYTANINVSVPRTERLTYTITDNNGATDQAYVYITVTNAPPSANKDLASTNSGTLVSIPVVTSNDNDPEGGSLTAPAITIAPKNGTATVVGNTIEYTPGPGFTGKDTLVYQLCETAPGSCSPVVFCDTALVVITVNNRVPVANNDSKTILPCNANTINLIGNDTDPENGTLTVTNLSVLSNPAAGTLVNNNDGTVTFTPAVGFLGVVSFTYTVTDNGVTPLVSAPATVTITVSSPVNTAPTAMNDAENTNMDQKLYYSVRDNDTDPEDNPLTIPTITVAPLHGTAVVNPVNGQVEYTPNPGYFGTDVLTYSICDIVSNPVTCATSPGLCATATLTITIDVPNTTNAVNDENSTWVNTPVSGGIMDNDYDLQRDGLIFTGFINNSGNAVTSGSIIVSGIDANGNPVPNAGTLTINTDGTYTYTPALNFVGVVTVPYTISDNNNNPAIDTAFLKITVNPLPVVSNSLIANNDENLSYGNPVGGNVLLNDRDPQGNSFSVTTFKYDTDGDGTADGTGIVGTPVVIGGQTTTGLPVSNAGTLVLNADGTYTFTPAPDFHGSIDVPYTICDNGVPVACTTAILHIDVLPDINGPLNDPPFAGDDFNYTTLNTPVNGNFTNNDTDPNGNPISVNGVTINTGGPHTLINTVTTAQGGTVLFYADGTYTYNPPVGYTGPDYVNYTICDVTVVAPQPLCAVAQIHFLIPPGSTLPATGLRATASLQGNTATIKWETISEQNSDYFTIERSLDNNSFNSIGTRVNAAGNSNARTEYQVDDNISSFTQFAIIYYRVKLTDIDGKAKYSNVAAVRISKSLRTTVWPNPFSSAITINVTTTQSTELVIRLTDVAGRTLVVKNQTAVRGVTQVTLNELDKLSNGIYLLNVTEKISGNNTVIKLVKQN
jgi:hypothetical protein